ncbi:DUF4145 domain-containing protein [Chryseolinea sp. T2]|uniref:DUF4145 domain-containing protein n=1 Tax=Chryseolinea sp. T2 TaxID=3129255 RepID=UPI0030786918
MSFDKELWVRDSFSSKYKMPNWICPHCSKGILQKDNESISTYNSVETNNAAQISYNSDELAKFNFSGYLKCNGCNERVVISGYGIYFDERLTTQVLAVYRGKRIPVYYPTHFQPELKLFRLPNALSTQVYSLVKKSFGHLWYDLDACANKIRQALESLVIENNATGDKLDHQIRSLTTTLGNQVTETMLALKHIGNDGSHKGRPFERSEILDAYCLLEDLLNMLYPDTREQDRRAKIVQTINSIRGMKKA